MPCPFCGKQPIMRTWKFWVCSEDNEEDVEVIEFALRCTCPVFSGFPCNGWFSEEDAFDAWNTRMGKTVTPPPHVP